MQIEIEEMEALEILEVLRLTPIYTLLGSDQQEALGDDFKPWKWLGFEGQHAAKAHRSHAVFLAALMRAKGMPDPAGDTPS